MTEREWREWKQCGTPLTRAQLDESWNIYEQSLTTRRPEVQCVAPDSPLLSWRTRWRLRLWRWRTMLLYRWERRRRGPLDEAKDGAHLWPP
jgi:hypothetical protein